MPKGLFYAVTVAAVGAWSWERWQSEYNTAIAALTASACTIALEIALSVASPGAARSLFGDRGGVYVLSVAAGVAAGVLIMFLVP